MRDHPDRPIQGGFVRCTKRLPCPICSRPDWCSVASDGAVAVCMRIGDGARKQTANGGWFHILRDDGAPAAPMPRQVETPPPDWTDAVLERHRQTPRRWLADLAEDLGLTVPALDRLRVFRCESPPWRGCSGWPMRWANGKVVGIRVRTPQGRKISIKGSRNGLFLPWTPVPLSGPVLVVEGNSDCAAALSLGIFAIGRPSCVGGEDQLAKVLRGRENCAIFADRDGPGLEGAQALGTFLGLHVAEVVLATPPDPHKDLRDWLRAGATRDDVLALVADASPLRWEVAS